MVVSVYGCSLPVCQLPVAGCRLPVAGCRLPSFSRRHGFGNLEIWQPKRTTNN
jgi:hypothetical protein